MANTQQISAKASGAISFVSADQFRRNYTPAKTVEWDTGSLLGSTLYVQIPVASYYWISFQLDSFTVAGQCGLMFNKNSGTVLHEVTNTITLGSDANHKAGTFTAGLFSASAGDNFQILAWHSGGGGCTATITAVKYLL